MYIAKLTKDIMSPLECGMDLIKGKWQMRIITLLHRQPLMRFSEIRRELGTISDGVLSAALRQMRTDGIVEQRTSEADERTVLYRLTKKGEAIIPIFDAITAWTDTYHTEECRKLLARRAELYDTGK